MIKGANTVCLGEKIECSGCGACSVYCPKNCIKMLPDEEGFLYPQINEQLCLHCGLCKKICDMAKEKKDANSISAYGAFSNNEEIRLNSSSGGLFSILATYIIEEKKGVCFGACFNETLKVVHKWVDNISDLKDLCGSKYVQSDITKVFKDVEYFLRDNRLVLFTGTPCQVAAVKAYLEKRGISQKYLVTADIICHGVPSPLVWKKYLEYRQEKERSNIKQVTFRDKTKGWRRYALVLKYGNGTQYYKVNSEDPYMRLFLRNLSLRPSCYHCQHKGMGRVSDFTLADFWGCEKVFNKEDDNKGTSLLLVHSDKGEVIFEAVKNKVCYEDTDYNEAISFNQSAIISSSRPPMRDMFFIDLQKKPFHWIVKKYCRRSLKERIKVLTRKVKNIFVK